MNTNWAILASVIAWSGSVASAADGVADIRARDSRTLLAVTAFIHLEGPAIFNLRTDDTGRVQPKLPAGDYQLEMTAEGYEPVKTHMFIQEVGTFPFTVALTPLAPPSPEEESAFKARLREGYTLVTGLVMDDEIGKPIRGARIRLEGAGKETTTDARGEFYISIPTPPIVNDIPTGMVTLSAEAPGYKMMIVRNIMIASEVAGEDFKMVKGVGTIDEDHRHKLSPLN